MRLKFKSIAAAVLATVMTIAGAQTAAPLARIANGEVVTAQDLSSYLARRIDLRQIARNSLGVEGVVQEMLMTRALVLEGGRLNMPRKAEEGGGERFDDVYGLSVYNRLAPVCETPATPEDARKYFDAHPEAFVVPAQARVERIMLPADAQIGSASAMAWLQDQARAVIQGKRAFGLVALRAKGEYSLEAQGDLGWITLEGDHTLMRALQTVKAGELLGPVQDGDFVYLFSVVQKREPRQLTWEDAKPFAANRAVSHCRQQAQTRIRTDLFTRYGMEIDRTAIRDLMAKANSGAAQTTHAPAETPGATGETASPK